ncbi:protein deglycase YajL [Edwardsiella piscicida]|uniref:4-methyl-5(B-hydroxyethyl)-thiazole monophosphate biosynthesis enzyme n=3 Tax=Edwardsiella TaxID=635 RepID=A0A0H3DR44_EDWTF|nr:protein deglycase YajL [Edwardsiella piscicida]ACY83828.1 4-methyl-5(beta-hydroxyethyl)-thiazole monophosphate biosynthesis enzyme [Edwardsiella tarda EIB202]ADM41035.1 4-methyl-5(B-hydroxyethyl)-thiazole monophosphate biosynthesis enzyme [Edwardsiella tarda FL6-60]AGH73067.1 oxidative-stress-resistance chaperone [Edwardsiella piscicida C07-087]AOP42423.1 protein deglycase YajL [Edwardsiella piscicida]ARD17400.1 DJ-1 family protein [Edwardsiella piscicida]
MSVSALVCLAPGSEETEVVTTHDLLVRAGIRVVSASAAPDGSREIVCSRGVRLLADTTLVQVADEPFDALILPGGVAGAECLRDSDLVIEKIRQMHLEGRLIAAICAAPALILQHHNLFPIANMTGYPGMKSAIPAEKWMDKRAYYDERVRLLTSQGPGTSIDFALKIIDILLGRENAAAVAAQLVTAAGIHQYQDA